jgi:acetate kinase
VDPDDEVVAALEALVPLAPLHQPAALAGIAAAGAALPDVPAVACFDTAFHATLPPEAFTYPLPAEGRQRWGLRRFGFHGLSHAYASRVAGVHGRRVVTCHLGAGASLAAVVDGRCVDTTMGFTPNEGVPMATRSGSVDVGMLTWLLDAGLDAAELDDGLQHRSGLAGLAGTADMRAIVARDDDEARLAVDVWAHRVAQAVAAMATSAGGLDVLAFTGGIGEHSAPLRDAVVDRVRFLVPFEVVVVPAREDIEIARGARAAIAERG